MKMTNAQTAPMPHAIAGVIPFIIDHLALLTARDYIDSIKVKTRDYR
jgi:hypothetical protein